MRLANLVHLKIHFEHMIGLTLVKHVKHSEVVCVCAKKPREHQVHSSGREIKEQKPNGVYGRYDDE